MGQTTDRPAYIADTRLNQPWAGADSVKMSRPIRFQDSKSKQQDVHRRELRKGHCSSTDQEMEY